jgi:hypothetical protein
MEMKKWTSKVKRTLKEEGIRKSISLAIVSANNHHAGFDPTTVNIFRKTAISLAISAILIVYPNPKERSKDINFLYGKQYGLV